MPAPRDQEGPSDGGPAANKPSPGGFRIQRWCQDVGTAQEAQIATAGFAQEEEGDAQLQRSVLKWNVQTNMLISETMRRVKRQLRL